VKRRALLELVTALSAGTAIPTDALSTILSGIDDAVTERTDADTGHWEETTWEYSQNIWVATPGALLSDMTADIVALGALLKRESRPQIRQELLRASSEIGVYMGQEFGDLGNPRAARRCFVTAIHAADRSGDQALATWARACHAKRAVWEARPPAIIARLLDDATRAAGKKPGPGLPRALQAKAEFLAGQGDATGAEAALRQLRDVFAALPDTLTKDQISARGWPEDYLRFTEAFTYSRLGDVRRAHTAIDEALRLIPPQRAGGRANLQLMRALTLIHDREVGEGLDHAVATTRTVSNTLARRRVADEIIKALPDAKARAHPAARRLRSLTASTT
jgi:hypothetical protein